MKGVSNQLMNTYYIAGFPVSDELYHHGIKGQKWGIRRYQNEDGSLTPAGRERYGKGLGEYANKNGFIRRLSTGDYFIGNKRIGERREQRLKNKIDKNKAEGKDTKRLQEAYNVQKTRNIARDLYNSRTSTGKLFLQTLFLGESGADSFRSARGRGQDMGKAVVGTILGQIGAFTLSPLAGSIIPLAYDVADTSEQLKKAKT